MRAMAAAATPAHANDAAPINHRAVPMRTCRKQSPAWRAPTPETASRKGRAQKKRAGLRRPSLNYLAAGSVFESILEDGVAEDLEALVHVRRRLPVAITRLAGADGAGAVVDQGDLVAGHGAHVRG